MGADRVVVIPSNRVYTFVPNASFVSMADVTLRLDGELSLFAANHSLWPQLPQSMWRAGKHNQLMNALDFQVRVQYLPLARMHCDLF